MGKNTGIKIFKHAYTLGNRRPSSSGFGWPMEGVDRDLRESLKTIQESIPSGSMLELGCGEGRNCIFFAKHGFRSTGVDFVPAAIRKAKRFAKEAGVSLKTEFSVGNILDIPYPKNSFDVVVDWSLFDHIEPENWGTYLKNLLRVLKPGGFFHLSAFSANSPSVIGKPTQYYWSGAYSHFFTERDIRKIFGRHFKVIRIKEGLHRDQKQIFVFYHVLMRKVR